MCVRSSTASYGSFSLDMDRSPGFGSATTDYDALFRLGFPSAPYLEYLTSPGIATRRTVLQKVRGSPPHRGSVFHSLKTQGFRFSFTPLPGSFSPFLHSTMRYRSLRVFSLGGWSPLLPTGFPVSRGTLDPARPAKLSCTGLSPSLAGSPKAVPLTVTS